MLPTFFGLTLLALALPFTALAEPHAQPHMNRHRDIAKRALGDVELHKRFSSSRWTFYAVGLGACGKTNVPSDFIVALNTPQFGGGFPGPNCFKSITMTFNGKTTQATIMDECPGCPYGGLDLSTGLFDFFASPDTGVIYGTWNFNGGGGNGGGNAPPPPETTSQTTTYTPPPTTHKTSTSTSTVQPTTSTESSTTTSSSSSRSTTRSAHSSASSSSISVDSPTGTVESSPTDPENINAMNQAVIGISAIIAAGANAV